MKTSFLQGVAYFSRIWVLGWKMVGKTMLAYLILSLWSLPLVVLGSLTSTLGWFQYRTFWETAIGLLVAGFILLVYVPLTFYVAASWVGFCPRISSESVNVRLPAVGDIAGRSARI